MTGHQAFVSCNLGLMDAGDTVIEDPPTDPVPDTLAGFAVTFTDADTISVAFTNTLAATERIAIYQSIPEEGAGDPNFNQARFVGFSAAEATTPVALDLPWPMTDGYTANFWGCIQSGEGLKSPVQKDRKTYTAA